MFNSMQLFISEIFKFIFSYGLIPVLGWFSGLYLLNLIQKNLNNFQRKVIFLVLILISITTIVIALISYLTGYIKVNIIDWYLCFISSVGYISSSRKPNISMKEIYNNLFNHK